MTKGFHHRPCLGKYYDTPNIDGIQTTFSILGAKKVPFSHRKRCAKSIYIPHVKKYQIGHEFRKCFFFTLKTMARKLF